MKLEIEVPDGFVCGKLIFASWGRDGLALMEADVEHPDKAYAVDENKKTVERRIPWEAD